MKELQEELQETEIEAVAADGGVTVVISGSQVPISVDVTAELLGQGADAVSEAVSLAAKEAHTNSMEYAKQRMSELYACAPRHAALRRTRAHARSRLPCVPTAPSAARLAFRCRRRSRGERCCARRRRHPVCTPQEGPVGAARECDHAVRETPPCAVSPRCAVPRPGVRAAAARPAPPPFLSERASDACVFGPGK